MRASMETLGHDEAKEKLREVGLRVTPQRRAVLSAFEEDHLTADEVFARARRELPELSRATVYNALAAFVEVGILRAVESRGALLYDPNPDPTHHHFRCRRCDRLYDVHVAGVEALKVSGADSFVVERQTVLLGGLCPLCAPETARR
jgi:Fe2+ or Zn2+ uptake regulation protein